MDCRKIISVVVPMYFEEKVAEECYKRLSKTLSGEKFDYEIIFINDGSKDNTEKILFEIASEDKNVRIINFSRNFGHQAAVTAGIYNSIGDAIIIIDADLQDPPSLIIDMVSLWEKGYDVVYAQRKNRKGETKYSLKKMIKFVFDGIISFSTKPLKLVNRLGFITVIISLILIVYSVYEKIIGEKTVAGWASIMVVVTFLGGVQLISVGILGEYIARIYDESKNRPLYIIKDKINF